MKFRVLMLALGLAGVFAMAGCEATTCSPMLETAINPDGCVTVDEWNALDETTPVAVVPATATLSVGEVQAFQIMEGRSPYHVYLVGCLGGEESCSRISLDSERGAFPPPFRTARRESGKVIEVAFLSADLRPVNVILVVRGSNNIGQEDYQSQFNIPLKLEY